MGEKLESNRGSGYPYKTFITMPDPCPHVTLIKQSHKELFGNGNQGIIKEFTALKVEFKDMNAHVEKLATSYSALVQSEIAKDAIEKQKILNSKTRSMAIQKVGAIFGVVFGLIGALYLILDHISNH